MSIYQRVRHALGRNRGCIMSWLSPEGRVFIGLMCYDCGTIHGHHDATAVLERAHRGRIVE